MRESKRRACSRMRACVRACVTNIERKFLLCAVEISVCMCARELASDTERKRLWRANARHFFGIDGSMHVCVRAFVFAREVKKHARKRM